MVSRFAFFSLCFLCLFMAFSSGYGQGSKTIDSLLVLDRKHITEDKDKIAIWLNLAEEYAYTEPQKGLNFAANALQLSKKLNLTDLEGESLLKESNILQRTGKLEQAKSRCSEAIKIFENSRNLEGLAKANVDLGYLYSISGEQNKAIEYYTKSMNICIANKYNKGLASAYGNMSTSYMYLSNNIKALEYNSKSLEVTKKLANKRNIAALLLNAGIIHYYLADYPKAITSYFEAIKINKEIGSKSGIAKNYYHIGLVYELLKDYQKSKEYFNYALAISEEINDKSIMMNCYSNIATIHFFTNNLDSALYYQEKSLVMAESIGNKLSIINRLNDVAEYHLLNNDYNNALHYNLKSRTLLAAIDNKKPLAYNLNQFASILLKAENKTLIQNNIPAENRLDTALFSLQKAMDLAKETDELTQQREVWRNYARYYEQTKDYSKALDAYQKYISIRDSVDNIDKRTAVARKDIQFQFDRKGDSLVFENQLAQSRLQHQELLGREQGQKLLLANQDKELKQLEWLGMQSALEQEQLLGENKERMLLLSEKEQQLQKINLDKVTDENELHKLRLRQQQLIGLATLLILMGIASFFFYRYRIKKEREKETLERRMSEATLSSLHAQMNPHFIFNCLGSIKQMIQLNEQENANTYLNKFAKLIRLSLEHSRRTEITLREKNTYLVNYLDMEQLRFDKAFEYKIEVATDLDIDEVTLPPMMIQPLVENALWHGLMNKISDRKLLIKYRIEENTLVCIIEDNGVGIHHSKNNKEKNHNSIGIKSISERLALLNEKYKLNCSLHIVDKSDEYANETGTIVTLTLPAMRFRS